jgi:hypothetical protein
MLECFLAFGDKVTVNPFSLPVMVMPVPETVAPAVCPKFERSAALVWKQMKTLAVNRRSYLAPVKPLPGVVSTVNLQPPVRAASRRIRRHRQLCS